MVESFMTSAATGSLHENKTPYAIHTHVLRSFSMNFSFCGHYSMPRLVCDSFAGPFPCSDRMKAFCTGISHWRCPPGRRLNMDLKCSKSSMRRARNVNGCLHDKTDYSQPLPPTSSIGRCSWESLPKVQCQKSVNITSAISLMKNAMENISIHRTRTLHNVILSQRVKAHKS